MKVNFPHPEKRTAMKGHTTRSSLPGATGLIFGRNVWQRDYRESLRFVSELREILAKYPS